MQNDNNALLSQSGAIIAAVSFFLPWIGCDNQTISGADMGGVLWIVFIAALIILGSTIYFKNLGILEKSRPIVITSALVAIGLMLYEYIKIKNNELSGFLDFDIKFGSISTLIGFILALFGSNNLESKKQ